MHVGGSPPRAPRRGCASRSSATLRLFELRFERQELPAPELLGVYKPVLERIHRLGCEPVDAHARVQSPVLFGNEAAHPERSQMTAHSRCAHTRKPGKLSGRLWSIAQKLDHLAALGIGQRGQRPVQGRSTGGDPCRSCGTSVTHLRFGTSAIDLRYLSPVWRSKSES